MRASGQGLQFRDVSRPPDFQAIRRPAYPPAVCQIRRHGEFGLGILEILCGEKSWKIRWLVGRPGPPGERSAGAAKVTDRGRHLGRRARGIKTSAANDIEGVRSETRIRDDQLGRFEDALADYETALVYLTVADMKLGRVGDARAALRQIGVAERIEPTYQALPLDADATEFESIAHQSGYPNLNTFFLAFRKAERVTPAEFRNVARRGK